MIASRCIDVGSYYGKKGCYFTLWITYDTGLDRIPLWMNYDSSVGGADGFKSGGVRPVIELNQGIKANYSKKYDNNYNIFTLSN